jgi:hypothetical protein
MNAETTLTSGERTRRLDRFIKIGSTLSASLNLKTFMTSAIATASEPTGCEKASILEMEEYGEVANQTGEAHYTEENHALPSIIWLNMSLTRKHGGMGMGLSVA